MNGEEGLIVGFLIGITTGFIICRFTITHMMSSISGVKNNEADWWKEGRNPPFEFDEDQPIN